jgi:hypothetical protein
MATNNNTTVAITISANTQPAETSVKSFKTQLREANGELVAMSEKFGSASTQAIAAAKKVAGLKDAIGDAKALAETFNPDKKFVALGGAIQGAVSAFSAVQAAQGLFGNESKELEKTMLKVQSAMALQQGISGVFNALDSFKNLALEIKGPVIKAFTTLRGALIATGIGAIGVVVGLLINNFGGLKVVIEKLLGPLASVGKFIGGLVDRVTDFIGVTSNASRELAKMREEADRSLTLNNKYLAQHGDQLDKYTKAKIEAKNRYLEAVKDEKNSEADRLEFAKRMNREIAAADKERSDDAAKAQEEAAKKAADKQKEIDDKRLAREKETQDKLKQVQEAGYKAIEEAISMLRKDNREGELAAAKQDFDRRIAAAEAAGLSVLRIREAYQEQTTEINAKYDKQEADNKKVSDDEKEKVTLANQAKVLAGLSTFNLQVSQANINAAAEQKRIDEEAAKNKEIVLSTVSNLGNRFADIVGRQTIAGKALAIASATIDTYQAANSALKANYGPFGPAAAIARFVSVAATIAAGIKNVKTIASTQVPGGGGGGGGSVPTPSIPTAPVLPQASSTTINQGQINQIGNVAARAFVVESDVSGNQERIQRLNRAARIS